MTTATPAPPTPASSLFGKYAAALLPAIGILFGALQVILADDTIDDTEKGQLIVLVAGLVGTFILPLVKGWRFAGVLKVGAAVVAAVGTLIVPLFSGFEASTWLIFGVAVLNALAAEIGVDMRKELIVAQAASDVPRGWLPPRVE